MDDGVVMVLHETCSEVLPDLSELLHACVHDGASVGFILPFTLKDAQRFWTTGVFPAVQRGEVALFILKIKNRPVGTVQLATALAPNQTHRADIAKLLVHPAHRRRGHARQLMTAATSMAQAQDISLLVLDTRSTDPARLLYESLGFETAGEVPMYARNPFEPKMEATTFMYKVLAS